MVLFMVVASIVTLSSYFNS